MVFIINFVRVKAFHPAHVRVLSTLIFLPNAIVLSGKTNILREWQCRNERDCIYFKGYWLTSFYIENYLISGLGKIDFGPKRFSSTVNLTNDIKEIYIKMFMTKSETNCLY